ncbi:Pyridine nucleotide-disulfide oxidoreductase domain-containing protein 1 [Auxenochlorella protothecoides]|uniref:Pyridine nucleotide-disulfide oxidoreductase domain-containing protein 1 n=2 Tax=Auxenochlorella protothecoides TaxID=3075 RepID=A0A087SM26_AUXPR|nr:Pyridine nucleotide-disulfide oxidoreductase domain-containing protein 1 [Auxenochlorella protothecoides]KFM26780.1 Pyridine nucleotide-disulfide oxidoreductase domain-containing protein 1 [Auxenochlorella protothecoides]
MKYLVLGGGVAGVCCAEELCRLCPTDEVTIVSAYRTLKGASVIARITPFIEQIAVEERRLDDERHGNLHFVQGSAVHLDSARKASSVRLASGESLAFDRLCIATGAGPIHLPGSDSNGAVLTLRDTHSIAALAQRLRSARHVAVIGNGGIALELIYSLRGLNVSWVVRHAHIGDAFFDADAARFLLDTLQGCQGSVSAPAMDGAEGSCVEGGAVGGSDATAGSGVAQARQREGPPGALLGHAVGPTWIKHLAHGQRGGALTLHLGCEVERVSRGTAPGDPGGPWPVALELSDGRWVCADVAVAALGVTPSTEWLGPELERGRDGGIKVDTRMQTSLAGVFAAGDACSAPDFDTPDSQWFQMRLWTQARSQGIHAAHAMAGVEEDTASSMAFELFTHVTSFAGLKVVLLGRYNGQGLENEPEADLISFSRTTPPDPSQARRGDLEEAVEHLILDRLDVGAYGPSLLDPNFELDHVFD